jgi:hypothetical protein
MTAWSFTFTPLFVIVAWSSSTEKTFPLTLLQNSPNSDSPLNWSDLLLPDILPRLRSNTVGLFSNAVSSG